MAQVKRRRPVPHLRSRFEPSVDGRRWVLVLPRLPLTANERLRLHWAAQRRDGKSWREALLAAGRPPREPPARAVVRLTIHRRRLQDPDNQVASVKPILNALVARGWLVDDSADHVDPHVEECKGLAVGTVVEWEEAR